MEDHTQDEPEPAATLTLFWTTHVRPHVDVHGVQTFKSDDATPPPTTLKEKESEEDNTFVVFTGEMMWPVRAAQREFSVAHEGRTLLRGTTFAGAKWQSHAGDEDVDGNMIQCVFEQKEVRVHVPKKALPMVFRDTSAP